MTLPPHSRIGLAALFAPLLAAAVTACGGANASPESGPLQVYVRSPSDSQSDLKNAQTVVEAFAAGNNGVYPATSSPKPLPLAVKGDSNATSLSGVTYSGKGGTLDTYVLSEGGYWLEVISGTTYYGKGAAPAISNGVPSGASTAGWTR